MTNSSAISGRLNFYAIQVMDPQHLQKFLFHDKSNRLTIIESGKSCQSDLPSVSSLKAKAQTGNLQEQEFRSDHMALYFLLLESVFFLIQFLIGRHRTPQIEVLDYMTKN